MSRTARDGRGSARTTPTALIVLLLALALVATQARVASAQQIEADGSELGIEDGENWIQADDGCLRIRSGERELSLGSCGESNQRSSDDTERPPARPEETTFTEETTTPGESASSELTMPEEATSVEEATSPDLTMPEETISETTSTEDTAPDETPPERTTLEETTGTPSATPTEDSRCPTAPPDDAASATVERAIDGDTVELAEPVEGRDTVRLIGADSPELAGEGGGPEPGAEEARLFTAGRLEGEEVLLRPGEDPEDDYGRLLAYVWTSSQAGQREEDAGQAALFNGTLLEEGHAEVLTVEPNVRYARCFGFEEIEVASTAEDSDERPDESAPPESPVVEDDPSEDSPSEEQYEDTEPTPQEGTVPEETTFETAIPEEAPALEKTAFESTASEESVPEETTALPAPDETTDHPGAGPAVFPHEETVSEIAPAQSDGSGVGDVTLDVAPSPPTAVREAPSETSAAQPTLPEHPIVASVGEDDVPTETMPTQNTADGPVAVLPDTAGPRLGWDSMPTLVLGVGLVASGVLLFVGARRAGGGIGRR